MSIRGTILARVDPYASELQPIAHPRMLAIGIILWPLAAMAAAAGLWIIRGTELAGGTTPEWLPAAIVGAILVSGLAAAMLIRPHGEIPIDNVAKAVVGVLLFLPLALSVHILLTRFDASVPSPYVPSGSLNPQRSLLRLLIGLLILCIITGLRPNARLLVFRSLLLRSGRVDRQTMLAMAGAIGVVALGDLAHLAGSQLGGTAEQTMLVLGIVLIAVGSMFVTLGLVGMLVDCVRIAPAVLSRPISLEAITREPAFRTRGSAPG